MKAIRLTLYFIVIGIITGVPCISSAQDNSLQTFTLPLSDPGSPASIRIDLHSGAIEIEAASVEELEIEMISYETEDDEDRPERIEGLKRIPNTSRNFELKERNNEVYISADRQRRMDFKLRIPQNATLHLDTHHNGDVKVTGISGEIEVDTHHGSIELVDISGAVVADTHHGEIKVTFNAVDANKPMAFSTYHGDVDITFPTGLNASTKIKSERGEIYTDFDMNTSVKKPTSSSDEKGTQIIGGGWLYADIGGGGAEFMFNTHHGDVIIRKR